MCLLAECMLYCVSLGVDCVCVSAGRMYAVLCDSLGVSVCVYCSDGLGWVWSLSDAIQQQSICSRFVLCLLYLLGLFYDGVCYKLFAISVLAY